MQQSHRFPVGQLGTAIVCGMSAVSPNLVSIPPDGMWLQSGETVWTHPTCCPIIIATAGVKMFVAPGGDHIVGKVIAALRAQGAQVNDIDICMKFVPAALQSEYVEEARRAGIRTVWTTPPDDPPTGCNIMLVERTK